eukprot:UN30268
MLAMLWVTTPSMFCATFSKFIKSRALICGMVVNMIVLWIIYAESYTDETCEDEAGIKLSECQHDGLWRYLGFALWPGLANLASAFMFQFIFNWVMGEEWSDDYQDERSMGIFWTEASGERYIGCIAYNDAITEEFWEEKEKNT